MSICPFWSSGNRKFECYSKCPMHKENTNEDCIFSLYLSQEHKNKGKKAINIDDIDCPTKKLYSLSDETKNKIKDLDKDVTIELINNNWIVTQNIKK